MSYENGLSIVANINNLNMGNKMNFERRLNNKNKAVFVVPMSESTNKSKKFCPFKTKTYFSIICLSFLLWCLNNYFANLKY